MNKYNSEEIQRELDIRQIQAVRQQIEQHREAIRCLTEKVDAIEQEGVQTRTPTVEFTQQQDNPERLIVHPKPGPEVKLGPCARAVFELLESSRTSMSEAQLQRCTQYNMVMLRKATASLLEAGLIFRAGGLRKIQYSTRQDLPGGSTR